MSLNVSQVAAALPRLKSYKLADREGMYLLVLPAGTKYWRLKYRFGGKEKSLSLGVYPDTSLAEARVQRAAMRAQLAAGTDPSRARRADLERERDREAQRIARSRFKIDEDGALLIRLGVRHLLLTPGETAELRAFLTPTATSETPPCP